MARTLSDLGVKLGIIPNATSQISFSDLNTELGVGSTTQRDIGGFAIAGISSLFTSDTTPDEATTVQFQMIPTDVAGSPGTGAWQASDLATATAHFVWGSSYFNGDPSDKELTQLFKKHIGLKIEITNRGIKNLNTRRRFMVNQLDHLEERVLKKIEERKVN